MRTILIVSAVALLGSGCSKAARKNTAAGFAGSGQSTNGSAAGNGGPPTGGTSTGGQSAQAGNHASPSSSTGGKSGGTAGSPTSASAGAGASADACPTCTIPPDCRGFSFDGLKYSPGGTTLPNKCKPFDATTNNPYAVRCIDAIADFKTPYAGDQYCILPPPPDQGIQVGLHPQGNTAAYWKQIWAGDYSGYEKPPTEWVLKPGDEITQNYRSQDAPNTMPLNYYRTYFRMRTGSHHMIVTMHNSTQPDGWIAGTGEALPGLFDLSAGTLIGILGGEQRADDNTPVTFDKPKDDDGLYLVIPASPSIIFNMHHFNITDKPLLREGWINIWNEPDARQLVTWYMGMEPTQVIGLSVTPNTIQDLHYSWSIGADARLVRVFGHRHFWTTNFSAWIARAGGQTEPIYQSYDWFDMPTYRYDSEAKNPPIDSANKNDGAASGIITLHAGDALHFNCHVEYTDQRRMTDATHAPSPAQFGALHFANEAFTGEMCIQFGNVTGSSLGLPGIDSSPVPDFAKLTR